MPLANCAMLFIGDTFFFLQNWKRKAFKVWFSVFVHLTGINHTQKWLSHLFTAYVLLWSLNRIFTELQNHRKFRLERSSGGLQSNLLLTAGTGLRSDLIAQGFVPSGVENLYTWKLHSLSRHPLLGCPQGEEISPCILHEHHLSQFTPAVVLPPTTHSSISLITFLQASGSLLSGAPKATPAPGWNHPHLLASPHKASVPTTSILRPLHWIHCILFLFGISTK